MPFYIVGKEISLEDVRLTLQKMSDRFFEHPSTVLVLTNLAYADAPWLAVKSLNAASSMVWHELPLAGNSAHRFEQQIMDLEPFLAQNWKAGVSPRTGNPVYERPVVLVVYREDHRFLLDPIIPKPGGTLANYDLVIASQPYRARASLEFKAQRVIAPLARAIGPGGRLIGIQSHGHDPGMEIIQKVWPGDNPFMHDRHQILKAVKQELGPAGRDLNFNAYADNRSLFRYVMHTLPSEISESIGTSTLFAAWNAAIYVAQVEDDRLGGAVADGRYIDATREVLRERGGLWFFDESYVISRRRAERSFCLPRLPGGDARSATEGASSQHAQAEAAAPSTAAPTSVLPSPAARYAPRGRITMTALPVPDQILAGPVARIAAFMAGFSVEATRPSAADIAALAVLGRGTRVYLSAVPNRPAEESLAAAMQVRAAGLEPVPHVAVRNFASERRARCISWRGSTAKPASRRVLVIAGDRAECGPFRRALDVIDNGVLRRRGIRSIGIAGYPARPSAHRRRRTQPRARGKDRGGGSDRACRRNRHPVLFRRARDPRFRRAPARLRLRASRARRAGRPDEPHLADALCQPLRRARVRARAGAPLRPDAADVRHGHAGRSGPHARRRGAGRSRPAFLFVRRRAGDRPLGSRRRRRPHHARCRRRISRRGAARRGLALSSVHLAKSSDLSYVRPVMTEEILKTSTFSRPTNSDRFNYQTAW